ncbi:MAG: hypothetical protein NT013_27160 [Planctomycetia bacterium]|nr:hypothetical protein [Planctomycetia bacterium]
MPLRNWLRNIVSVRKGALALCVCAGSMASADEQNPPPTQNQPSAIKIEVVSTGNSSAAARKKAIADIPVEKVTADLRPKVEEVLKNVSLFRRMPTLSFASDPDVYHFFITHPDVAVSIWRVMEISTFEMWQVGALSYEADSHDGSLGVIEVLHSAPERHLVLCEGSFKSPILPKPIKARALLHLQPTFRKGDDGQTVVSHTIDMFVSFPSQPVDITAKLISPVSHAMADRNFREVSTWCAMMSMAMCQQPGWVEQLAQKMEGVLDVRRTQLLRLAAQTFVENRKRLSDEPTAAREGTIAPASTTLKKAASEGSVEGKSSTLQTSGERPSSGSGVENANGKR